MNYEIIIFNNIRYIYVPKLLEQGLKHCWTTADLNMRIGSLERDNGDINNYYDTFKSFNMNPENIFICNQVHDDNIEMIENIGKTKVFKVGKLVKETDGLITNTKNNILITNYADCNPIILFDPVNKVHANIHSGWRGTLKGIVTKAIKLMVHNYNSNPKDILGVIGPSIEMKDFEVDEDVKNMFEKKYSKYPSIIKKKNENKYLIDLIKVNKSLLIECGLEEKNILNIDLSTFSNSLFHSYRRNNEDYSLMALITSI